MSTGLKRRTVSYHKYLASAMVAFRQQTTLKGQLIGRLFVYVVVVYLFHQIFQSVGAPSERVWYLAITEWLILSTPSLSFLMEQDIRSGQMAYFILRPMNYLGLRFCESLGSFVVRFVLLGMTCLLFVGALTGNIPGTILSWSLGLCFGILGVMIYIVISMLLGLSAFILREIQPAVFLNQTATFCFGGLIVPLSFYPPFWQGLSFATPYPWILWWPAQWMIGKESIGSLSQGTSIVLIWLVLLILLTKFCYRRGLKSFVAEGG